MNNELVGSKIVALGKFGVLLLAMVLALTGCSSDDGGSSHKPAGNQQATVQALAPVLPHFNQEWAMDKLWEDGLAEVAVYDAERIIYDKKRTFEYVQIAVKEEFNQEFNVKTDNYDRLDLFPVIKINQFCRIETDNYPYHFLTSLFFRRDQPVALYKMTTSSQEWCGNTFKSIVDDGVNLRQSYDSYWDGQGVGSRDLRRGLLLEDALPYSLRSLKFSDKPIFEVIILGLQQTSQALPPTYYAARISTAEAAPDEASEPAWRVTVQLAPDRKNEYWFAREYPNLMLRQTTWDGRNMQLKSVKRYDYWQHR